MSLRDLDIGGVRPFDVNSDPSSVGTEWKRWLRSFQLYADGKGLIIYPDKDDNKVQRRALLLHSAGPDIQDIFDVLADTGSAKDYQKAEDALTRHFVTQINTPYERHLFREMVQGEDETIDQFAIRLRRKAQQCDYGDQMEAQIRDQIISKCRSNELRRKLLAKGQTLTLQTLQEIARNYEAVKRQIQSMSLSSVSVNRVHDRRTRRNSRDTTLSGGECYRCGRRGYFARDPLCPARGKECSKCSQVGHFANVCKTKVKEIPSRSRVQYMRMDECKEEEDEDMFAVAGDAQGGKITVNIGGIPVEMIIDSGASANVISQALWEQLKKQHIKCVSRRSTKKLYAYGAVTPLEVIGTFTTDLSLGSKSVSAEVSASKGKENHYWEENQPLRIGKLKGFQLKLHIDEQVQPAAEPLGRPPFSLKEKIEKKLDELLREDIIEQVEGPTPWVNPVVVVPKPNGDVRLCVDMRCANKAIIRERHPIPTIDEVLEDKQEASVFSKLDLKWGYHQIELSEESRIFTTFVTHKGLFRYKRLMFGITLPWPQRFFLNFLRVREP
ncbi:uncharacterized protein K02A2.6-like [Acropora millepora]|uniref:uncharacterized protein K02A2.6-like n=1 Tax=Acropora millepora TaxID=45264 RepID=UPI001CF42469|nr:uncharacterized protein K02A2.6-like [Acropora millepora]